VLQPFFAHNHWTSRTCVTTTSCGWWKNQWHIASENLRTKIDFIKKDDTIHTLHIRKKKRKKIALCVFLGRVVVVVKNVVFKSACG